MFTGIVTDVGEVVAVEPRAEGLRRLKVACGYPAESIAIGASISHSGVCLTVVETGRLGNRTAVSVDAAAETLRLTTAGDWKEGTRLNLERAMKVGDELGGHIVTGHVDDIGTVASIAAEGDSHRITIAAPRAIAPYVAAKGSIALDGISLTINTVEDAADAVLIGVNIIPHTAAVTTFDTLAAGDAVHIEIDILARYLGRMEQVRHVQQS